jgi:hypothetical protein
MNKFLIIFTLSLFSNNIFTEPIIEFKPNINLLVSKNENTSVFKTTNYKFAEKAFSFYNKRVDTATLLQLIKISDHYKLNSKNDFKMCVGQLLVESGGKHYKNDDVVIGPGGYVGISQISPNSALAVFNKIVTDGEFETMKSLIGDTLITKPKTYDESLMFLKDLNNNLTFWGYLMGRNIKTGDIESALVKYNAGYGGYNNYIKSGGTISNHKYIKKIKNKLAYIK